MFFQAFPKIGKNCISYTRWESFPDAVGRAVTSCEIAGFNVEDHFREVPKMVELGSGTHSGTVWG